MAPGARGNPSCAKASNPYHECTQACLQPNKTLANNKNSDYKTTRAGGYGARPWVSDDNNEDKRGGGGGRGRGKQGGGCPKASNPDHHNGVTPPALKNESKRQQKAAALHTSHSQSYCSESSSSRIIAVGGYSVKESYGGILRSILHKYGDIAATSKLESPVMRSYYIECVCFVVNELHKSSSSSSSSSGVKLKELWGLVKDVESGGVRVEWLRSVLHELLLTIAPHDHQPESLP